MIIIKSLASKALRSLFHPYSPLLMLLIGGLVSNFVNIIEYENKEIIIAFFGIWIVAAFFLQYIEHLKNNNVITSGELQKQIEDMRIVEKELKKQIALGAGLIEARYGEFMHYITEKNIGNLCLNLVNKFPVLESVQIYDYKVGRKDDCINIKVNYFIGSEHEDTNINVMKQKIYAIDRNVFFSIRTISDLYDKIINGDFSNREVIKGALLRKILETLNEIPNDKNNDPIYQRISLILFNIFSDISDIYGNPNFGNSVLNNPSDIDTNVRTGILGCILLENDYMYVYNKSKENKEGRRYYSYIFDIFGQERVVNLVLQTKMTSKDYLDNEIKCIIKYFNKEYKKIAGDIYA